MIGQGAYSVPHGDGRALLLSSGAWCHLKNAAAPPPEALRFDPWAVDRQKRLERRRDSSNAILDTWDNTIKKQEEKLLNIRRKRAEEEETEKQKLDKKEEEYREEKMKKDVEAAKTLMLWQNDDIKTLHGAYLFSEILKEREAQVKFNKYICDKEEELEKEYAQRLRDDVDKYYKEEDEAWEKRTQAARENEEFLIQQMHEHEQMEEQRKKQKEKEKEIIDVMRSDYDEYLATEKEDCDLKKKAIKDVLEKSMEEKRQTEKERHQREVAEDEQLRLFAKVKENVAKIRKDRENEMHENMVKLRERLSEVVSTDKQIRELHEERCFAKAQMEEEAKYKEKLSEKAAKRKQMENEIAEYRAEAERKRKELEEKEKEEKRVDQELCDRLVIATQSHTECEQNIAKQKMKQLKEDQMAQQVKLQLEKQKLRDDEKIFYNEQWKADEIDFLKYADDMIKYTKDRGRPTYPMEKVVKNYIKRTTIKQPSKSYFGTDEDEITN